MGHDPGSSEGNVKKRDFRHFLRIWQTLHSVFLKEESFSLRFHFQFMASPRENTDAGDADVDVSTSDEEMDLELRVFS